MYEFGAFIQPGLHTLSLQHDSPRDNLYACVIYIHASMIYIHARKTTHAKQKYLAGLATK